MTDHPDPDHEVGLNVEDDLASSAEEASAIDALYTPIPTFVEFEPRATTLFDAEAWSRLVDEANQKRSSAPADAVAVASEQVMRAAAFDTGAVEGLYSTDRGFTITVATKGRHWEQLVQSRGTTALSLFEAQLSVYRKVEAMSLDSEPLTEAVIRQIHAELCEPQDTYEVRTPQGVQQHPLPKGEYKRHPNHVRTQDGSVHAYAPVSETAIETARLVSELRTEEFLTAHPVIQAAYVHYAFVSIHPFADGNGRVARALTSYYLYRASALPFMLLMAQREEYLNVLSLADMGAFEAFSNFVHERAVDAVVMSLDAVRAKPDKPLSEVVADIAGLLTGPQGLTIAELNERAAAITAALLAELTEQIEGAALPPTIQRQLSAMTGGTPKEAIPPYRSVTSGVSAGIHLQFAAPEPTFVEMALQFLVLVAKHDTNPFSFLVIESQGQVEALPIPLSECHPSITPALRLRLSQWTELALGWALGQVHGAMREALKVRGHIVD